MSEERDFKGVWIKKEIYLDTRLSALDKIVFAEIDSLDGKDGCFCSNEYLANFCQCGLRTASASVSKLVKLGLVRIDSFDGRTRILRSCLADFASLPSNNCDSDGEIHIKDKNNTFIKTQKRLERAQKKQESKKPYGTFQNVMLTDEEVEDLKRRFGGGWVAKVDYFSERVKSKGYKYASHHAAILSWERERNGGKLNAEKEYF